VYRALLRVFPAEFRGDFGDQMSDDFRDQQADAEKSGRASLVVLWARTIADSCRRGPREHLDILMRDAGFAVRLLGRRPGLAASAVLTLAIGIGLNAAVFSLINSVLWRDLSIPESDRLVRVYEVTPAPELKTGAVSADNLLDWRSRTKSFDGLTTATLSPMTLVIPSGGDPEEVPVARVSNDFFRVVPVRPAIGRIFTEADYTPMPQASRQNDGNLPVPTVAILSHRFWMRQFQGRADAVGSTVRLDRGAVEIVGVLAVDVAFPGVEEADIWMPVVLEPIGRRARYLSVFGRLAPGVSLAQAQAELDVLAGQMAADYPRANQGYGIRAEGLLESATGHVAGELWLLGGAASCVLLIACANVANLLLAFASGRRLELATRVALGAGRGHLVRQAMTEGLVLALAGGVLGTALALWSLPLLVTLVPSATPRLSDVSMDGRTVAFIAAVSLLVGLGCGLAGCVPTRHLATRGVLRSTGAGARQGLRFRQVLTDSEIAVALMLVVAAGLLVRTLRAVGALDLGFEPAHVLTIGITPDMRQYRGPAKAQFEQDLMTRVRAVPTVSAAGIGSRPLGEGTFATSIRLTEQSAETIDISLDVVGDGYLEALGARLTSGRPFSDRDVAEGPAVALVNAAAAAKLWPDRAAVGRTFRLEENLVDVVGVVSDVRRRDLEADVAPTIYLPSAQQPRFWTNNMLVRTTGAPDAVLPAVRAIMRQLDGDQALTRIQTLEERLAAATAPRRQMLWLVGIFSALAFGLALVGVYGVMAEAVAQRVPEIGVRMALGATSADVVRLILRQGGLLMLLGVILGLGGATALNRLMSAFVFRVSTTDPGTYVVAGLCLAAASLIACAIPAARAVRVDPVIALRQD
jgi:putative ABC transport system permease protein